MAKQKLTYQPSENYEIIVLATSLKDYRVSFFVNQNLHIQLDKTTDIVVDLKAKGVVMTFGQYSFKDELSGVEYYLVSNKSNNGVFLSSVKNFDFILVVKHEDESIDSPFISEKLRSVKEFQAAIPVSKLSTKDHKFLLKYI